MRIADAQPERILLVWPVVKAGKHVVEPVRIVEDAVVARQDRLQRRIVQRRKTRRDAVGKADQERVTRGFERIDVAKLVWSFAGKLSRAVCSQSRSADTENGGRVEDAVVAEVWRIEP